jgi:hypothetical protein
VRAARLRGGPRSRRVRIAGHGLSIEAPNGWEARIFKRPGGGPVLHLATFALHQRDGDFGAAATGRMGGDDTFMALLELRADDRIRPGVGLFEARGRPELTPVDFMPNQLQVMRPGQYGWQRFYTDRARLCCIYAVVMPARRTVGQLVGELARILKTHRSEDSTHGG